MQLTELNCPAKWPGRERRREGERRSYTLTTMYCCLCHPRRAQGRRSQDRRYPVLDVFKSGAITSVLLLVLFSVLDAVFTLTLLARGATELNPVMNHFIKTGTGTFVCAKMILTAIPGLIMTAAGNVVIYRSIRVHSVLSALVGAYAALILYEIVLLTLS